jgi:spore coat protein A
MLRMKRRTFLKALGGLASVVAIGAVLSKYVFHPPVPLEPSTLTKYVDPLPIPKVMQPTEPGGINYEVEMTQFTQKLHSQLPPTTLWGYNGTYPGPTFEVRTGTPIEVKWISHLPTTHLLASSIDHTIHGAETTVPDVRNVVHLHGGFTPPASDGYPEAWYTPGGSTTDYYPNENPASTLWYHDHANGITRLNIVAGLAGFYLIRDAVEDGLNLPKDRYEIPLVIQDRTFNTDGSLYYPTKGQGDPETPPVWVPEFFGDTVLVNGKIWPFLEVEPRKYRFRFLNGSNSRFYRLSLDSGQIFHQIGTDGGFLPSPVQVNKLLISPAERADVIVDFTGVPLGTQILLTNDAKAPFPNGDELVIPEIMQFRVVQLTQPDNSTIPATMPFVPLVPTPTTPVRDLTLDEKKSKQGNPVMLKLNGLMWDDPITENPKLGETEIWRLINTAEDTHPIHLHAVQFQILDRQPYDVDTYKGKKEIDVEGPAGPPEPNEVGWKDTVRANTETITRIIVKFGPFRTFNPTTGGNYVWHCHILEHEDNSMMRPYKIT